MATGTKDAKPFDLSDLESDDTATIILQNPKTGDDIEGVSIVVYGQDSEVFRSESRRIQNKAAEFMRRNRGKVMPPEEFERLEKGKVIACVKEIVGLAYKGSALTDPADVFDKFPWIFEQVVQGIMDRGNFIKG